MHTYCVCVSIRSLRQWIHEQAAEKALIRVNVKRISPLALIE